MDDISELRVGNEAFLVASMIERCPRTMMLRELVQNAIEAAARTTDGDARAEIGSVVVDGARKLCIWNTGPGLDAAELYRMCDIASSVHKQVGLDGNFGMGAKVASLPANQHGMRYRSCRGGRVHEVTMGKRHGVYGRLRRPDPATGLPADVVDATADAARDGRTLHRDWTEVVLLGNRPGQDTAADPFDGALPVPHDWVAEQLQDRWFRLPPRVAILLLPDLAPAAVTGGTVRRFVPVGDRLASLFTRHEAVDVGAGMTAHFGYVAAPAAAAPGALPPWPAGTGLVHRDEIYTRFTGRDWGVMAPLFGIPYGARHLTVLLELAGDGPYMIEGYRQFLRYQDAAQWQVDPRHHSSRIAGQRPQWLLDLLRELAPRSPHAERVGEELAQMLAQLRVRRTVPRPVPPAPPPGPPAADAPPPEPQADPGPATADSAPPEPGPPEPGPPESGPPEPGPAEPGPPEPGPPDPDAPLDPDDVEPPPEIVPLRDPADIALRGLDGRGGRFSRETNTLFVNMGCPAVARMAEALAAEHAHLPDQERVRALALQLSEVALVRRIGRVVVLGLARRDSNPGLHPLTSGEVDQALSVPALALAADDFVSSLESSRSEMARTLVS